MSDRLPCLSSREVYSALDRAGFVLVRTPGTHRIYAKGALRVNVPKRRTLTRGTLGKLIRDAGLTQDELKSLLK